MPNAIVWRKERLDLKFKEYDVIIAGSGISGLYAALCLDSRFKILMLSKREISLCNSALAQGGVAAVMDKENDSFDLHIKDTLVAGKYKNDMEHLRILVEQGPEDVKNLAKFGVVFDTKPDGTIHLTLEGGHSRRRIAHHKDTTGKEIETRLIESVQSLSNVTIVDNAILCDLKKDGGDFYAQVLKDGKFSYFTAPKVVLATGGIGRVYNFTTNSAIATGDGISLAYNVGARIKNLSYIQFHPTAFADKNNRESFLISEAVRGEGAHLLNCKFERFMDKYEPERRELAPRDVVSKCIIQESLATKSMDFYLDISHKDSDFIKNRFPMIHNKLLEKGFDLTKEPVPIFPCQHYLMGGIDVDTNGESTVSGLYAAGECSHTGVHGANRLASNSLLEALVFSRRIAENIEKEFVPAAKGEKEHDFPDTDGAELPTGIRTEVRGIMQSAYFVEPHFAEAKEGLKRVSELLNLLYSTKFRMTQDFVEAKSLTTVAYIILKEVVEREDASE